MRFFSLHNPSGAAFFERKYRRAADPWHFASDTGELARYECITDALAKQRYCRGFEPGCSIGVLTARLAPLCDALEAIDFSETALLAARERCARLSHVQFRCLSLPDRLPATGFDLLVLSEIGYYFTSAEWQRIAGELVRAAEPGTTLLASHWLGSSPDHRLSGDQVHAVFENEPLLRREHSERHPTFRLDRWTRIEERAAREAAVRKAEA